MVGRIAHHRDLGMRGLTIGTPDCMIAATVLAYGQTIATLNHAHFQRIAGLRLADIG